MEIRTPAATQNSPAILSGRVIAVDAASGRVDVQTIGPYSRTYRDCEVTSAVKGRGLGGIDFKPVVGAHCVLIENLSTSPNGISASPLVIGFRSLNTEAKSTRVELVPGDVRVQGTLGNDLLLRNNGDVYLLSDQQTLLALLGTEELVRLNSPSFAHTLAGGSVRWSVAADEMGGPVAYVFGVKEFSSDAEPYLRVSAGAEASGGLSVTVFRPGAARGGENPLFTNLVDAGAGFQFDVSNAGDVFLGATGTCAIEAGAPLSLLSAASVELLAPNVSIGGGGASVQLAPDGRVIINAPAGVEIDAPSLRLRQLTLPSLTSDQTAESKRLTHIDLLPWLFTHVHPTPGGISLGPLGAPQDGGAPSETEMTNAMVQMATVISTLNTLLGTIAAAAAALPGGQLLAGQLALFQQAVAPYLLPKSPAQVITSREDVLTTDTKAR